MTVSQVAATAGRRRFDLGGQGCDQSAPSRSRRRTTSRRDHRASTCEAGPRRESCRSPRSTTIWTLRLTTRERSLVRAQPWPSRSRKSRTLCTPVAAWLGLADGGCEFNGGSALVLLCRAFGRVGQTRPIDQTSRPPPAADIDSKVQRGQLAMNAMHRQIEELYRAAISRPRP